MSKIEQVISEIEEYIDGCSLLPLSKTKIVVEKEELEEMLHELRLKTPDEIKKYQKLLKDKDRIMSEANAQAERIISTAQIQTTELVNEHEIMQRAYDEGQRYIDQARDEAQRILDEAVEQANEYKQSAIDYTDQLLASIQATLEGTMNDTVSRYEGFMGSLNETLNMVINNRVALVPQNEEDAAEEYDDSYDTSDDSIE